jgi:hypothetical protein
METEAVVLDFLQSKGMLCSEKKQDFIDKAKQRAEEILKKKMLFITPHTI